MNRTKRLTPLLDYAESREAQAAVALGKSQQKLQAAHKSLRNLLAFKDNYTARFHQSSDQGLRIQQLTEFRAFLHKINAAIDEQEKAALQAEAEANARRSDWQAAHQHAKGMKKLIAKARADEYDRQQKEDQGELDERAGRQVDESSLIVAVPSNPLTYPDS
jgi:flagellar FliJ protein